MKFKTVKRYLSITTTAVMLSACSGVGSCPSGDANLPISLQLTAPNQYPAGIPVTAYLTLTNTSQVNATNLYYTIPDNTNYTGTTITVANGALQPCLNIAAGQSCTFPVELTNNPVSHPGSFTVTATPNGGPSQSSKFDTFKSMLGLQSSNTLTLTANIGLIDVPDNTAIGANGITFLYTKTIPANPNGDTLLSIVGVVGSDAGDDFNTINLTDVNGNLINFEVTSPNSGTNKTNLKYGDVVSFLLKIPAGSSSYKFYSQTMKNGVLVNQGDVINPITLKSQSQGILIVQPTDFSLSADNNYESQVITFTNIGNGDISNFVITPPPAPLVVIANNCSSNLGSISSGKNSCTYTVKSNAVPGVSGFGNISATSDGGPAVSNYTYSGKNPVSGISLISTDNPTLTFVSDTESGTYSSQLILTNTGNVSESNFLFTLPQYFSLSAGNTGVPCTINNNIVSNVLAHNGDSCTLTITYTNNIATSQNTSDLSVDYMYLDKNAEPSSLGLTYQTTQASAVLQVTYPSATPPYNFSQIIANSLESSLLTFTVSNTGTGSAYNVGTPSTTLPFSVVSSTCGNQFTQLAPGSSCDITAKFGPVPQVDAGYESGLISLSYKAYSSAVNSITDINVAGTSVSPLTANIEISTITYTNISGGNGESVGTPFALESSLTAATATITYVNSGLYNANNFTVDTSLLSSGYTVNTNNCNAVNLGPVAGSCTVVFNVSRSIVGNRDLNLANLKMSWSDQSGSVLNQPSSWNTRNTVYATVYGIPSVTSLLSSESTGINSIESIPESSSFYAVFKLSGGYQVADMSYSVTPGTGGTPAMYVDQANSCTLSSNTPVCSIKLNAGGPANGQTVTYNTIGGAVNPNPSSSNIDVYALPTLSISLSESVFYIGGESSILTITMTNAPVTPTPITISYGTPNMFDTVGTCNLSSGNNTCTVNVVSKGSPNFLTGTNTITATGGGVTSNVISNIIRGFLIYTTESSVLPNFAGDTASAISNADSYCNSNKTMLGGGVAPSIGQIYALLAASSTRNPTTSWPLKVGKYYVNSSRQFIGQAVTLPNSRGVGFSFPITSAISPLNESSVWTGLDTDWAVSSNTCSGWTSNSNSFFGSFGLSNKTDINSIYSETSSCDVPQRIYCVYGNPT